MNILEKAKATIEDQINGTSNADLWEIEFAKAVINMVGALRRSCTCRPGGGYCYPCQTLYKMGIK